MADKPSRAFREGLQLGPLGLPANVTTQDPEGLGDRSSVLGDKVIIPSGDPNSLPHELMHANLRSLEGGFPGAIAGEGLLSALAERAYGNQSQYLNPFERVAYGYQEGKTGQPDASYQKAVAGAPKGIGLHTVLDLLGRVADAGGRKLGEWQR